MSPLLRSRCFGTSPMTRSATAGDACAHTIAGAHSSSARIDQRIARDSFRRSKNLTLALLNHDLGGLDHCGHLVALFQTHLFRAALGDDGLDDIVADLERDERGNSPENDFGDFTLKMIASTECHRIFSSTTSIPQLTPRVRTGCARSKSPRCGKSDDRLPPPGSPHQ